MNTPAPSTATTADLDEAVAPFTAYLTSEAHTERPDRKLYCVDTSKIRGFHFDQTGFTTRHIADLITAATATDAIRREAEAQLREEVEVTQAKLRNRVAELEAQVRDLTGRSPDGNAGAGAGAGAGADDATYGGKAEVEYIQRFLAAWRRDFGARPITVVLKDGKATRLHPFTLQTLLDEVTAYRAAAASSQEPDPMAEFMRYWRVKNGEDPEAVAAEEDPVPVKNEELDEAVAQLAEFMTFWDSHAPGRRPVNVQSLWKDAPQGDPNPYAVLPAQTLRVILAHLQEQRARRGQAVDPDPLAPPVDLDAVRKALADFGALAQAMSRESFIRLFSSLGDKS